MSLFLSANALFIHDLSKVTNTQFPKFAFYFEQLRQLFVVRSILFILDLVMGRVFALTSPYYREIVYQSLGHGFVITSALFAGT